MVGFRFFLRKMKADSRDTLLSRTTTAAFDSGRVLTHVRIDALIDAQLVPAILGPHLLSRMHSTATALGRPVQMLGIEIVENPLLCPRCGFHGLHRQPRQGVLQRKLLPLLGIYPWNCFSCGRNSLLRLRRA